MVISGVDTQALEENREEECGENKTLSTSDSDSASALFLSIDGDAQVQSSPLTALCDQHTYTHLLATQRYVIETGVPVTLASLSFQVSAVTSVSIAFNMTSGRRVIKQVCNTTANMFLQENSVNACLNATGNIFRLKSTWTKVFSPASNSILLRANSSHRSRFTLIHNKTTSSNCDESAPGFVVSLDS